MAAALVAKSHVSWSWAKGSGSSMLGSSSVSGSVSAGDGDGRVNAHRNPWAWSKQMPVDECIAQLDALAEPLRGICLRTPDRGTTEHISAEEAILFLQEILRERRAVKGGVSKTSSVNTGTRRKERAITPFNVSVPDVTRDLDKEAKEKEAAAKEKETKEAAAAAPLEQAPPEVAAAPAPADAAAPAVDAANDPHQLEAVALERARRLMEVQAVLDAAQPEEFVGLSIDVHEKRGTISEYVEGKYKVKFDSGGEIFLDKITATHLADTLPSWA